MYTQASGWQDDILSSSEYVPHLFCSHQVDPELSPYEGLVVLRAWPGPTVPAGTVSA